MATASASATQIRYLEEVTPGTVESGNQILYRVTKESLNQSIESQSSQELRADRQVSDVTLVSGSVGGSLDWELSLKTHDTFLEALLSNTWVVAGTDGVDAITSGAFTATNTITSTTEFPAMEKGQWFRISGHSVTARNGIYRCSSSVAPTTSIITLDSGVKGSTSIEAAGAFSISTSRLKNGSADLRTFSIEKAFSDVNQYFMATGMYVQSMTLNFNVGEPVTGSFAFLGMQMARATSTGFSGTDVAATTSPMINTVNNTVVELDGALLSDSCAESFSLTISNGAKERRCLGSGIGLAGITEGSFDITGSLNIYFGAASSAAVYDKMLADQPVALSIYCEDSNGDGYAFSFDRAKISSSEVVAGGINTDVMMTLEIKATIATATSNAMVAIDRIGSVA